MEFIIEGLKEAITLLLNFDSQVYTIIGLSIVLSFVSTFLSALVGVPLGIYLGIKPFRFKKTFTRILYTLMSLPPVVIGLLVAIFLSRSGPLGTFGLLFTPTAMVIAQMILISPIILGIVYNHARERGVVIRQIAVTLGANSFQTLQLLIKEMRIVILIALVTGFGRAISEVGAVMIVGGNIKGHTRVMTTYIAMNNSMGNYGMAIAMGIVLLVISFVVNSVLYHYVMGEQE